MTHSGHDDSGGNILVSVKTPQNLQQGGRLQSPPPAQERYAQRQLFYFPFNFSEGYTPHIP